ncbi:Rne/Rng family ribonuclease [Psychrobacter cryohalolentis]|uniref:Rne/Rng family ribonuclease n=1 Tax=Psychrobacter sp. D2 TaxID=2759702 RepID=UPI0015E5E149|nr:Rne/Rng family ribonuclease [Psychrobacter sp. D2]MBA2056645.1 Rne/Rng family ribonuclease [Psychrobacter sp. D2]
MKRILINATQNEEIRVALCKGNHLYDFDLENRTREQKKSNIYKGHVTRVEPSLEAVFVEYGSQRQGFLPIREISAEYLSGNPRDENIKKLIKEGDELIVQVEKEERGNKGAALSTYVSLAGRYLVLMPNNPRGGGISRQISGKLREDMKRMLGSLDLPKGMSVIIRTAGIGKTQEDLQHDLNHLLNIWQAIQEQNQKYPSPRLVHQEAGVVTRAVRDYLRDDISEIWIDNENAYIEAAGFIDAVMPKQAEKLRKYTDYEPMFSRFNIEKQIETAYQREVRLPSGGSIVIDQTEALVSIDINSAKSTKGSDVAETAYHTNLEAADEIARQLRLRDMGGLIVIDFIDMNDNKHQKEVEKRLIDATKYDRARVQFGDISKFGLMEMSRQRLRPSLEESTGYICPRCHGNGMIRDLRSLSLSIMRQIEQIALKERQGEVQAEVPTDIAAFLLNEKRDSLVYLEQDSGTRITILPHAHLESPNFKLHFNRDGFAPSSYERITDTQLQEHSELGYNVDWQTAEKERPEQQPTRQPRQAADKNSSDQAQARPNAQQSTPTQQQQNSTSHSNEHRSNNNSSNVITPRAPQTKETPSVQETQSSQNVATPSAPVAPQHTAIAAAQPQAVAWLSNLFAQAPQAQTTSSVSSRDAAEAIEALVNTGAQSLGSFGQVDNTALANNNNSQNTATPQPATNQQSSNEQNRQLTRSAESSTDDSSDAEERRRRKPRKSRPSKPRQRKEQADETENSATSNTTDSSASTDDKANNQDKRQQDNRRHSDRNRNNRQDNNRNTNEDNANPTSVNATSVSDSSRSDSSDNVVEEQTRTKRKSNSQRGSRGKLERGETLTAADSKQNNQQAPKNANSNKNQSNARRNQDPNEVVLQVNEATSELKSPEVVHLSLDDSKSASRQATHKQAVIESDTNAEKERSENNNEQRADKQKSVDNKPAQQTAKTIDTSSDASDNTQQSSVQAETSEKVSAQVNTTQIDQVEKSANPNKVDQPTSKEDDKSGDKISGHKPAVDERANTKISMDSEAENTASTQEVVAVQVEKAAPIETTQKAHVAENTAEENVVVDSNEVAAEDSSNQAVLELSRDALFAERYVAANKFGQASNDPRVVRLQQVQASFAKASHANEQDVQVGERAPTIRGTVGEFIRATLAEAENRLATDGVISCFNAAIAKHLEQTPVKNSADKQLAIKPVAHSDFDFSNYGYQPLAADYIARFESMTKAVSQFAASQGKTSVEPRAISKRASNDPRGQHPDYKESAVLAVTDTANNEPVQTGIDIDAHEVEADALANQAQTEAVSDQSKQLLDAEQTLAEVDTVQAHIESTDIESIRSVENDVAEIKMTDVDAAEVANVTVEQSETVQDAESIVAPSLKDDSQAAKSKTTIASYKNMIENVAEQLLPQKGMFNLTTPKVPKARARKPKADHKKPTQAEKLESDDSDNSNRDS